MTDLETSKLVLKEENPEEGTATAIRLKNSELFRPDPELNVGSTELIKLERRMEAWEYEQSWQVSEYKTFKDRFADLLVDKSSFLRAVLDSSKKVIAFGKGSRMGKTMNLTMLQAFVDDS